MINNAVSRANKAETDVAISSSTGMFNNMYANNILHMYKDDPQQLANPNINDCSPSSYRRVRDAYNRVYGDYKPWPAEGSPMYAIWNNFGRSSTPSIVPNEFLKTGVPGAVTFQDVVAIALYTNEHIYHGDLSIGCVVALYHQTKGWSHSVIFMGYTYDDQGNINGFQYWDHYPVLDANDKPVKDANGNVRYDKYVKFSSTKGYMPIRGAIIE
jgi:hypothetical protein